MKTILFLISALMLLAGCKKTASNPITSIPEMEYIHFNNQEVHFNQRFTVDMNHDGIIDFSAYTLFDGDPVMKADYHQYYFGSAYYTDFPINNKEEVPMLNKGDRIDGKVFTSYNWYNASDIVMAQKVVTKTQSRWEGMWKNASHQYLPLRINVDEETYYGWIEVSFDSTSEKIILHKAAMCEEAGKAVKAGF